MASNLLKTTLINFTNTRLDSPPQKLHKYPHLSPGDTQIWNSFLTFYPRYFDAVAYDVHVGDGQVPPNETDPAMIKMARDITTRRIDVLAERTGRIWIVELKWDPGVSVVGQLISYRSLMLQKDPAAANFGLMAIMNRIDPDLKTILDDQRILYHVVTT